MATKKTAKKSRSKKDVWVLLWDWLTPEQQPMAMAIMAAMFSGQRPDGDLILLFAKSISDEQMQVLKRYVNKRNHAVITITRRALIDIGDLYKKKVARSKKRM